MARDMVVKRGVPAHLVPGGATGSAAERGR